jgi:hypothetical protein
MAEADILDYGRWDESSREVQVLDHPMVRRMTGLQKVVASVFCHIRAKDSAFWEQEIASERTRIYATSLFGELPVMELLTGQVVDQDFPLSPKNFQNSVLNAGAAYGSIMTGLQAGIICCSGDFCRGTERSTWLRFALRQALSKEHF